MVPDLGTYGLGHSKIPGAAEDIPSVFPDGPEALLEEVDRLACLDLLDGGVVVVFPEVLD